MQETGWYPPIASEEYRGLFGWEKRANEKLYRHFCREGMSRAPSNRPLVKERALYLSWRGSIRLWTVGIVIPSILGFVSYGILRGLLSAVLTALAVFLLMMTAGMGFLRIAQSRKRHPEWRRLHLYVEKMDWFNSGG
jgi:hypothetical protein